MFEDLKLEEKKSIYMVGDKNFTEEEYEQYMIEFSNQVKEENAKNNLENNIVKLVNDYESGKVSPDLFWALISLYKDLLNQ